ncbi:hypothetical protein WJX75_002548 [Coccomyxa subellipsoidea]|uniref:C-type lectin domain-containing protein n=1 Tax=Coccomyxa subellipsoidea TaxID=248742 RepID=A0ABR2Z2N7_9CHLO
MRIWEFVFWLGLVAVAAKKPTRRDVGQANQRTSGNERRLFITVLSSTHHDNLCLGLEKLVSHVLAKTPGDTYIWSVNNSAEAHVSSRCGGLLKSANVVFEALGDYWETPSSAGNPGKWHWLNCNEVLQQPHNNHDSICIKRE